MRAYRIDDDFVVVQQQKTTRWSDIFTTYFVSETSRLPQITSGAVSDDDLVFYVERRIDEDSHGATVRQNEKNSRKTNKMRTI